MNFQELVESVIVNTNRPELLAETKLAVQRATVKMHHLDFFANDLTQATVTLPIPDQRFDLRQLGPHFRKLAAVSSLQGVEFPMLDLEDSLRPAVSTGTGYIVIGGALVVKSKLQFSQVNLTYYSNPIIAEATYDSWMATNHPFAIIDQATADVFGLVGNAERANYFMSLVGNKLPRPSGHIAEILSSNTLGYDNHGN